MHSSSPRIISLCVTFAAVLSVSGFSGLNLFRKIKPQNPQCQVPISVNEKFWQITKETGRLTFGATVFISSLTSKIKVSRADGDEATDPTKFITTDSGLKYYDIEVGTGEVPKPGDFVRVHYTGWLDGFGSEKKFDSSYDRRSPLGFPVGMRKVIAGWDEGILSGMKVGGKRNLIIPPELGYGSRGAGGVIPPNATLYFSVELVGIGVKANR